MNDLSNSTNYRARLDMDDPHRGIVDDDFLKRIFLESMKELVELHAILFEHDLSERTFAHRLGVILERRARGAGLTEHFADVEYNKLRREPKYLPGDDCICDNVIARKRGHDTINADLILHARGLAERQYDNLIAVELKRTDEKDLDIIYDRCRLHRMTLSNENMTAQNYRYGMLVVLKATRNRRKRWRYLNQVNRYPEAHVHLEGAENLGYYEVFVKGEVEDFVVFPRP